MRSRFVLLLAAAIVFAPGWAGGASAARDGSSSDLAARVLAPTFDEAPAERTTKQASTKQLDRGQSRRLWHKNVIGFADAGGFEPPSLVLVAAVIGLTAAARFRPRLFRSQRAPPLQTV
ncbi:MAG: hypothetical protein M3345_05060 [Actinomycetota bacterium]|nr:hypothetical protein [Actinomycetota bacterium]